MRLVPERNVDARNVHPDLWLGLMVADEVWRRVVGYELYIYSLREGVHSRNSRHYIGMGADTRTWTTPGSGIQLEGEKRQLAVTSVRHELNQIKDIEYLVLDEDNHLHIQLQRTST